MTRVTLGGRLVAAALSVVIAGAAAMPVNAALRSPHIPYTSYNYNNQDSSVTAPVGYIPQERYTTESWGHLVYAGQRQQPDFGV